MREISLKAVVVSSIFNFVLMVILIMVLAAIFASQYSATGGAPASEAEVSAAFEASWLSMLALVASVAAGYLAAAMAKRAAILHGALSSSLNVAWGVVCLIFLVPVQISSLLILAANPLLGVLGGYIWLRSYKR